MVFAGCYFHFDTSNNVVYLVGQAIDDTTTTNPRKEGCWLAAIDLDTYEINQEQIRPKGRGFRPMISRIIRIKGYEP